MRFRRDALDRAVHRISGHARRLRGTEGMSAGVNGVAPGSPPLTKVAFLRSNGPHRLWA